MLHWLKKELIPAPAADWIDDCALWAVTCFDRDAFWNKTELVQPDAGHFPEKVSGAEPMARYVLGRVTELAGLSHWPWQLVDARQVPAEPPPHLELNSQRRFVDTRALSREATLPVPIVLDQLTQPQDLTASIAHTCARHLLYQSRQTPPGGSDYFEQASEVMASFLGFGVMLTNTAYTFRGGCARGYNPRAHRRASLSEAECLYTLALFAQLKGVPNRAVFRHLKPHLKSSYKLARKQIGQRRTAERLAASR